MKKLIFSLLLFVSGIFSTQSQESTATWSTSITKESDTEYTLVFKANLKEGWHLYSQFLPEGGPLATEFTFENPNNTYKLIGKTWESETHKAYEEIFEMETSYFEHEAIFKQKIKLLKPNATTIQVVAAYQTCDDQACTFEPGETLVFSFGKTPVKTKRSPLSDASIARTNALDINIPNKDEFLETSSNGNRKQKGLSSIFLLGFLGGLIALLTPCVFPMIPLTVSFFTKQAKNKKKGTSNAILYGLFITLILSLIHI